ncbi:helix-turn-helix domain-containing protein [Sinomicrobium weinanense]|uniref:Helix-turn-helix transcriptional regulator n=1 Tax=Sinomicrobium weinanense TaxID=2842200 RepID=A0A926Q128_9FLAO|nr:AraC family transcriptional regulator [Sinomicrobium weinanense]MBC9794454.1 helix-turn-helix transcriptional regulator [Sinomicrobium weinanense]MBU3124361.1 AraC family transcriptional regulator [Sinomicrobium weinanense]
MEILKKFHREITPLSNEDCFLVFDRVKDHFDFPIHYHPEFELNFISNGKGVRRVVGDHMEEIEDIELVLVGPNLYHGWETHNCSSKDIHEVTIQFQETLFNKELLGRSILKPIRVMLDRAVHGICFSRQTAATLKPRIIEVSKLDGMDYFLQLISILNDLAHSPDQRLLSTNSFQEQNFSTNDSLQKVYTYIQGNYAEKITLSQMARLINRSNVSFSRFIKKHTGKTFVEYLNDVRIGYAARWLIEKDYNISEIAYMCGFNNIANFNRVFRNAKNCTPTQYRENFSGIKKVL